MIDLKSLKIYTIINNKSLQSQLIFFNTIVAKIYSHSSNFELQSPWTSENKFQRYPNNFCNIWRFHKIKCLNKFRIMLAEPNNFSCFSLCFKIFFNSMLMFVSLFNMCNLLFKRTNSWIIWISFFIKYCSTEFMKILKNQINFCFINYFSFFWFKITPNFKLL